MSNNLKSRTKLLCVIDNLGSGGAQRQLVNLAISLKKEGINVSFLVYHKIDFFKEYLVMNEIPVYEIVESNYLYRIIKLRNFIRKGNYTTVISYLISPNFICELSGIPNRKYKLIVGERSAHPNIAKSLKQRFIRLFHWFSDSVVTNSHENLKLIKKVCPFINSSNSHVIYNLIDFDYWYPQEKKKNNSNFILTVLASHQILKNLSGLIEAVNLLNSKDKDKLQINWYGAESKDDSKLKGIEKIKKYNLDSIFNFYEPIQNVAEIIRDSDAVGLFSFYEGLPNVICESMSMSKTIIASHVSDIPLLILNHNLLFNPNDPYSIKNSLEYLLSLSNKELEYEGKKNREFALENFDIGIVVSKYLELIV